MTKTARGEGFVDINDDECILVEFINEKKNDKPVISVGFQDWLRHKYKRKLESIIRNKTKAEIYWPDIEVSTAKKLIPKLKNSRFTIFPVRVLSRGGKFVIKKFPVIRKLSVHS